jgi:hypothetical protein
VPARAPNGDLAGILADASPGESAPFSHTTRALARGEDQDADVGGRETVASSGPNTSGPGSRLVSRCGAPAYPARSSAASERPHAQQIRGAPAALLGPRGRHRRRSPDCGSPQRRLLTARPPARGTALRPRNTADVDADLPLLRLAVATVQPDDDVRLRDGRQSCARRTTGRCRRKREKSLLAASLWMLAQEPDVDPASVPDATRPAVRGHRRRDRDGLDGVCDQPSPSR